MNDMINHPNHYTQGIECWDFIVSHKMGYLEGNIIKYVTRYKDKDGLKDLLKAQAYLHRLIEELAPMKKVSPFPSPIEEQLEDVRRLNGAVQMMKWRSGEGVLVSDPGSLVRYDGAIPLPGPILDGRNCPQGCGCSDHQCQAKEDKDWLPANCAIPFGIPEETAPQDLESYCLGDFHRAADWFKKACRYDPAE